MPLALGFLPTGGGHVGTCRGWEGATHLPHATRQLGGRVNPRLLGHKTQLGGRVDFTVLLVGGQVYTRHPSARWCSVCPVLAIDHTCSYTFDRHGLKFRAQASRLGLGLYVSASVAPAIGAHADVLMPELPRG